MRRIPGAVGLFPSHLRRNIEDYGLRIAMKKAIAIVSSPVYLHRVCRMSRADLEERRPALCLPPKLFACRLVTCSDRSEINQIEEMANWLRGSLEKRIREGCLCTVVLNGKNVAGFNLTTFGKVYFRQLNRSWSIKPQEAWSEDTFIVKAYRNMGLGAQLGSFVFQTLESQGVKYVYSGIFEWNVASQKSAEKIGFRPFLDVHYKKVFSSEVWQLEWLPASFNEIGFREQWQGQFAS